MARVKSIALAVGLGLIAVGGIWWTCVAVSVDDEVVSSTEVRDLAAVSPLSRTVQLAWDNYDVVTYTGLVTDAPPAPPVLRMAARLVLEGEEIYAETVEPGLSGSLVVGTGFYGDPVTFFYPDFYGEAEEWVGCWWEGEGWPTTSCNPGGDPEDGEGYALWGNVEARPMLEYWMPVLGRQ